MKNQNIIPVQGDLFSTDVSVSYNSVINPKQVFDLSVSSNDPEVIKDKIRAKQESLIKSYLIGLNKSREQAYYFSGAKKNLYNPNIFSDIDKYIKDDHLLTASTVLKKYTKNERSLQALERIIKFLRRK
jgi:hypothetical protein